MVLGGFYMSCKETMIFETKKRQRHLPTRFSRYAVDGQWGADLDSTSSVQRSFKARDDQMSKITVITLVRSPFLRAEFQCFFVILIDTQASNKSLVYYYILLLWSRKSKQHKFVQDWVWLRLIFVAFHIAMEWASQDYI